VTDADVVLGILDPKNFLGGDMPLDLERAREAAQRLAQQLGVSALEAAFGIFSVVGESMAAAARAHATDRGVDFRGLPLLAFAVPGQCTPATSPSSSRARRSSIADASVLSALARWSRQCGSTWRVARCAGSAPFDWKEVGRLTAEMRSEGRSALLEAGLAEREILYDFSAICVI